MTTVNNTAAADTLDVAAAAPKKSKKTAKVDRADEVPVAPEPAPAPIVLIDTSRLSETNKERVLAVQTEYADYNRRIAALKAGAQLARVKTLLLTILVQDGFVEHSADWIKTNADAGRTIADREYLFNDFEVGCIMGFSALPFNPLKYVRATIAKAKAAHENEELPTWAQRAIDTAYTYNKLTLAMQAAEQEF